MKEGYIVLGGVLLFQLGRVVYFYYQKWKLKKVDIEITDNLWETYLKQREYLLSVKAENLGIQLNEDNETVFGVGHETHYGTEVRLLLVFRNAKISTINTLIAREQVFETDNMNVKVAITSAMSTAQYNFARMRRKNTSVPEPGYAKFYILTGNDVYAATSSVRDIVDGNSKWEELFNKIDAVFNATVESDNE
ncbi:hypothetical protein ACVW0P_004151 [Mucilaginibacter sp. UYNi724]